MAEKANLLDNPGIIPKECMRLTMRAYHLNSVLCLTERFDF